jgi:predicted nucleic acid-binding protein
MPADIRVLLDVDVILDVVQRREPHYAASSAVLAYIERGAIDGLVSAHSVTTLYYLVTRYGSEEQARVVVSQITSLLEVATVDKTTIRSALQLGYRDFEDAVQMVAAVNAGASYVVTRNVDDYTIGPLPALRPAELLPLLSAPA